MDHTPIAIGTRTFWVSDEPKLVLLHPEDRAQHLYIVGKTGLGKSTLLRNLILQDLYAGRGVGLLDAHGDLAREVLDAIPRDRTGEVLYFNPGDLARPVGLNLLPKVPQDQAHLGGLRGPVRLSGHLGIELGTAARIHPGALARGTLG